MAVTGEEAVKFAKRYRFAIRLSVIGAVLFCAGVTLGFYFNGVELPHFGPEAAKAVVTLGIGLILGGALKVLLDTYQNELKQRAEEHELRERLLADLRDVHDRVENARLMIPADKSTVSYAEQMQDLIGCQVTLQNIKRTRDLPPDETQGVDRNAERLANVIGYLRALQLEYAHNYSGLADRQRYDNAITSHRLRGVAAAGARFQPSDRAASDEAWRFLSDPSEFPVLDDMTKSGARYITQFRLPLHELIAYLRNKTADPKQDTEFDDRVNGIASAIAKAVQSVQPKSG